MLSKHWHTLLLQSLHNDHWRNRHTNVPEHTEVSCPQATAASSASWSIASDDTNDPIESFKPEYFVEVELPGTLRPSGITRTADPTIFLAGLIKIMWDQLASLWRQHLDLIHELATTKISPVTREESILRTLQEYRESVEPVIRNFKYFPDNAELFIKNSSLQQLQNYIAQYSPVILASHARHQPVPLPALHARHPTVPLPALNPDAPDPPPAPDDASDVSSTTNSSSQHPALEEAEHRKRNRQRIPIVASQHHDMT
jgi:hypothetical protein